MRINKLNIALLLGFIVIVGIMGLQFFLLRQAFQYEEKKFAQKVHVALLEVASKLNIEENTALPQTNPIEKLKDDYYVVNINSKFEVASLDYYLKNEFEKFDLVIDFEYGYYDCTNECMKYGDYVTTTKKVNKLPYNFKLVKNKMSYYFVISFPHLNSYIYKGIKIWIVFSLVMLVVLILYGYSAFTLLQQKKYAELQKDFINNMTHEFKNPISSILLASNFLDKQPTILQDEKLKKYTELINQQAYKLNGHVEKILQLAKNDNKPIQLQKTKIDVIDTIKMVIANIILKYPTAKINLESTENIFILADEFHFSNLVYNLLDNAIKYNHKIPLIIIKIIIHNNQIQCNFIDNGIGIPTKEVHNVFEKFYRVKNTERSETTGFGLGLFYVNRICKEHKWLLQLASKENVGTTVKITIPIHE